MPPPTELQRTVEQLEQRLLALAEALRQHNGEAVASAAAELQRALAVGVEPLRRSAAAAALPPALRQRLAVANAQVAAQREALARAGAALDRAIGVLLPATTSHGAYGASGIAARPSRRGVVQA